MPGSKPIVPVLFCCCSCCFCFLHSQEVSACGLSPLGRRWKWRTHVDLVLLIADQEVVHHACLIQVPQADHVIYTLHRDGVHGAEGVKVLCSDPVFLEQRTQTPLRRSQPTAPLLQVPSRSADPVASLVSG